MSYIYIAPIALDDHFCLERLEKELFNTFKIRTMIKNIEIDLKAAFDIARGQYNSSLILQQLVKNTPHDAKKILGVVEVDLFIPIFTFVFGEAQLNGPTALVSTHRLHNRFYGLPENNELMTERLVKEAIHELGHTFGLVHCLTPKCVMNSSTYVENIDQKTAEFCPPCEKTIKSLLNRETRFPWRNDKR